MSGIFAAIGERCIPVFDVPIVNVKAKETVCAKGSYGAQSES